MHPKRICNVIEEHENRRHKTNQPSIQRGAIKEPNEVVQSFVSEKMKLQSPRLMLGFKMNLWMKHLRNMFKEI